MAQRIEALAEGALLVADKVNKMPDKMPDELLDEYARLTHAVSLSGEWGTVEQIEPAVLACRKVNADQPKVAASIGMN